MHRSSETVAAIATALAKAQVELSNPEKTAVGLISNASRGEGERSFRYAPLSTGLELVRKSLGGHQIAVLQTTEIDRPSGTVNLTTVLMHTSGEWISSDWPVCQLADASMPRRMGAALTYARRYSLFALVGIAGEDDGDLDGSADAPGAMPANVTAPAPETFRAKQTGQVVSPKPNLIAEQSTERRDQLLDQIRSCENSEGLHAEAIKILRAKNSLQAPDAKIVEGAFKTKMAMLEGESGVVNAPPSEEQNSGNDVPIPPRRRRTRSKSIKLSGKPEIMPTVPAASAGNLSQTAKIELRLATIDKSLLALGEPRRQRDKRHLRFVALQPCLVCGRSPSDPHHLRFAQPRAMGRKTSDEFVVPLCRSCHRQNHQVGDERTWWKATASDPIEVAERLWKMSRGVIDRAPTT